MEVGSRGCPTSRSCITSCRKRTSVASLTSAAIWVIDRKHGIVRRQSPEVTAAERELYTLEDDDGTRDRSVESALAGFVDGPGQKAIRVLDEGGRLAGEDAGKL